MAKVLNLSTEQLDDETFMISWQDVVKPENQKGTGTKWGLLAGGSVIGGFALAIVAQSFFPILLGVAGLVACIVMFKKARMEPNAIKIGKTETEHRGLTFDTSEITRFEYGLRSQLTGQRPQQDGYGQDMADPMIIRMWLNDSSAHTISTNNWQNQVNHEIRDALASALKQVRKEAAQAEQSKTYGDKGEFGVPDY